MTYRRVTVEDLDQLPFPDQVLAETEFRDLMATAKAQLGNECYVLHAPSGMAIAWTSDCESLWDAQVVLEAGSRLTTSELRKLLEKDDETAQRDAGDSEEAAETCGR